MLLRNCFAVEGQKHWENNKNKFKCSESSLWLFALLVESLVFFFYVLFSFLNRIPHSSLTNGFGAYCVIVWNEFGNAHERHHSRCRRRQIPLYCPLSGNYFHLICLWFIYCGALRHLLAGERACCCTQRPCTMEVLFF